MEGGKQQSSEDSYPIDVSDPKYVSGLSAILVATIEEAKDRISQIEYIFCKQLFPDFQSKSRSLQKIYSEAKRAAEDVFKEKEKDLLIQIERHHVEMKSVVKKNNDLELEKKRLMDSEDNLKKRVLELQEMADEREKCNEIEFNILQEKSNKELEVKLLDIHQNLANKSREVDEGLDMQKKLAQMVQAKASFILQKEKQLKEQERMIHDLISKNETFKRTCNNLEEHLKEKIEQVEKGQVLQENLAKQIDLQILKMNSGEKLLSRNNEENELLRNKVQNLEESMSMLREEHANKIKEQLHASEERVQKLQVSLKETSNESSEGIELHRMLLQQIKAKDAEILSEKKRNKELTSCYKRLKSEHLYLREKHGLTPENMLPEKRKFAEVDSLTSEAYAVPFTTMEHGKEENIKQVELQSNPSPKNPSTSASPVIKKGLHSSSWRNTRLHQQRDGPDPHDDFLDTPLENIRENIKNGIGNPDPSFEKKPIKNLDNDEEHEKKREPIPKPPLPQKDFKFVEPVRKKADRENLKGIECKQCKKFYDAVLNGDENNKQELRCEHHDGVSRHRYRYAPPLTPEGFWNIGFDSEI
ncbi:protein gamma response 1 [Impatiens glandulifera]|uniref:protein gamma response 1 n=1 Tax=Impatiens glandulifera TaxID=253017 RepID=UPI001FB0A8E6|nr:protein gamma response 1 [Impatiens glandulifera]